MDIVVWQCRANDTFSPAAAAGSGLAATRMTLLFNEDRQRRNKLALILSRRQNSGTDTPLLDCRENSSRHIAALRLIRLIFPIVPSKLSKTGGYCPDPHAIEKERRVVTGYRAATKQPKGIGLRRP